MRRTSGGSGAALAIVLVCVACGGKARGNVRCGPGTVLKDGVCVAADAGADADTDTDADADTDTDVDTDSDTDSVCDPPNVDCFGECVSLASDRENCGGCGIACSEPARADACVEGDCECGSTGAQCAGTPEDTCCPDGDDASCVDTLTSDEHCGGCDPCPPDEFCVSGACASCGEDCWGETGCMTDGGRCIRFTCRSGEDTAGFCDGCFGWQDMTYDDWMGGACLDVQAKFQDTEGASLACGPDGGAACCESSADCSGVDGGWIFDRDGDSWVAGPNHSIGGDANCRNWDFAYDGPNTLLSVCVRP